jgi:hypothetical protein
MQALEDPTIKQRVFRCGRRFRRIEAIEISVNRKPNSNGIPPAALAIIASSVALSLSRERQLGVSSGHDVVLALIDAFLKQVDD